MRSAKVWMFSALLMAMVAGTSMLVGVSASRAQPGAREERREERNYWRHHDGRWSHWDARDQRWYFTDGSHWFFNSGKGWHLYRFDKTFGREGFVRGQYAPPGPGVNVVVPQHEIYVGPPR